MPVSLAALPRGHRFPPTTFTLAPDWVRDYVAAVDDTAIVSMGDGLVPPMALAALSIRALLERAALPAGAVHLGQELSFHRPVSVGERLAARAAVISRGERQGWVLMGVELAVDDVSGEVVMEGRATVTFPSDGSDP